MISLADLRTDLDSIDPRLWPLALALVAFAAIWAWRRYLPNSFAVLPKAIQALPAVLIGAILGGATGGDLHQMIVESVVGALSGVLAIGSHHALKSLPGPYGTKQAPSEHQVSTK